MTTLYDFARERVSEMDFTDDEMSFIFANWDNFEEHLEWLMTATREEIEDWIIETEL